MKRKFFIINACLIATAFFSIFPAHAQITTENISTFDTVYRINENGSIAVTEQITYDFGAEQRHGIYRDIPLQYRDDYGKYNLRMADISVVDERGDVYPIDVSNAKGGKHIRIGDPNVLVTGVHTYAITYTISRAITFHDGYDEFYWNTTGNDWGIPIQQVTAQIVLPSSVSSDSLILSCTKGSFGDAANCDNQGMTPGPDNRISNIWFNTSGLGSAQGMTFRIKFPKGIVHEPTAQEKLLAMVQDNWSVSWPFITFVCMYILWKKHGKDPKGRGTIIAEYEAPGHLLPAQVGSIYAGEPRDKDVAATIIHLAIRGYIKIKQEDAKKLLSSNIKYTFIQVKEVDDDLVAFEKELMDGLFRSKKAVDVGDGSGLKQVVLSDLNEKFHATMMSVKNNVFLSVKEMGYASARPSMIRALYIMAGAVVFILSIVLTLKDQFVPLSGISLAISGIVISIFGYFMPQPPVKGVLAKESILGLREYLHVAEEARLKFHNAPTKKPETFEKLLPYAIVLGVEKEWAAQFNDLYTQPPEWYQSNYPNGFNSGLFIGNLNAMTAHAATTLSASPASSGGGGGGGGFSGGGFGGGGGGSW